MRRRQFIGGLAGTVAWPLAVRAQQSNRMRRIGVLMNLAADDPESHARIGAFLQGLQEFGWAIGRNVRIDYRWTTGGGANIRQHALDLVSLAPDVILANGNPSMSALLETTRSVPIVFGVVSDPVSSGFIDNIARPGGNATGFISAEFGMSAKWLELLKEIAPQVTRVAVLQDPGNPGGVPQFAAMQSTAPSLGMELTSLSLRDADEIERAIAAITGGTNAGLIVTRTVGAISYRDLIVAMAARHRLPAVYPLRLFVTAGGLICYGPNIVEQFRRAAGYVDRILKGEKPSEMPVLAPTKYELAVNLQTAKALGLNVPHSVLARADEVIE
jgi:putative tryptophan/tyrosine transport system substrate-binding protein